MKKNLKKSKKGFTLIELVVVIAILGILAAILVPVISGFIKTANDATDNANARLVYQSAAMWYATNNTSNDDLVAATTSITTGLGPYLGYPVPTKRGDEDVEFSAEVGSDGVITVMLGTLTYNSATGKLS